MHTKKLIAPIIVTILLVLFLFGYMSLWAVTPIPLLFKIIPVILFVGFIGVAIHNLIVRIKEIRSGEEDDLSKY